MEYSIHWLLEHPNLWHRHSFQQFKVIGELLESVDIYFCFKWYSQTYTTLTIVDHIDLVVKVPLFFSAL